MAVKQWCNTCNAQVEGANACTWDMCPLNRDSRVEESSARVKEIKCTTCGHKYPFNKEALDLVANTCKNRLRTDYQACKIKHWSEFIAGMNGEPKQQPIARLLQDFSKREQKNTPRSEPLTHFDIDIPDVLCIRINKKGNVHVSKEQ